MTLKRTSDALARTINIGAWDGPRLIGSVRVLTDGSCHVGNGDPAGEYQPPGSAHSSRHR